MANKLARVFTFCRLPLSFFQSIRVCFAIGLCILTFPLGGFIRNMSNQKNFIMAATGGN